MTNPEHPAEKSDPKQVPLVVDVDGTLLRSDLLHEAALQFVAQNPLECWKLLYWLLLGKAVLKSRLAERGDFGIDSIPLRDETMAAIRTAQAQGRETYLASASDHRWVDKVAERVGGLTGVLASDGETNLAGTAKAAALTGKFGRLGFDYIGDARVDIPVWEAARGKLVVAHRPGFAKKIINRFPDAEIIVQSDRDLRAWLEAMRPHQWAKNLLLFLPLLLGHRFLDVGAVMESSIGFVAFCLAASSAYIINDLLDLPGDRDHHRKCNRPFADCRIRLIHGPPMALAILAVAIVLASLLNTRFLLILLIYVAATLSYSLLLKRRLLVDVITLGGLYTLRVLAGVIATGSHQSPWLLMFSLFIFLSLAIVKRCSELVARREAGKSAPPGRGYRIQDLEVMFPLGAAAGFCAILVITEYLSSPEVVALYSHPQRLWLICPLLLYWIGRILVLASRNELHDDPIIFAARDRNSWLTAITASGIVLVSI
ncbi:UbiA family prenyltransferase [Alteraurantiacibacter aestuarii]|uniref:UbiA family prenyltransferase n=1 Tax=Alteraurantiacibacter aestuarii TaxID=650004 RepID=A0A844ZMI9_9SPHN|nr:UbiA family prenyltransferase [Alteraurantiacibacter aestuarii]MXO88833.1 UbiA family prenyltransferase [Alteraurantiacibacter aestuarii]